MTQRTMSPGFGPIGSTAGTRALLACGVLAGPLFVLVALAQAFTRPGFDVQRHPVSLLSLGELGWVQIGNFVISGLLVVACAVGMRRALRGGSGEKWGPRLIGAYGVCLVAGGVFVADPGLGYPPGTPPGVAENLSWHGILHAIAPVVGFISLIIATFVFAFRFAEDRWTGWAGYSALTGIVILPLSVWPNLGWDFVPLWIALVLGFGWASAVAARLMAEIAA